MREVPTPWKRYRFVPWIAHHTVYAVLDSAPVVFLCWTERKWVGRIADEPR